MSDETQPDGCRYADPVDDDTYPRVTAPDGDPCSSDLFPESWGSAPTERDQAAIDAGNA